MMVIRATFTLQLAMRNTVARRVARFLCSYNCNLRFAASPLAYAKHFRVCVNTRNNIVQLVVQHCCVASCRANVARITNSRAVNSFVAESRKSFYFMQQSRATKFRVVIRATFTLQLFAQECCATSFTILFCSYWSKAQ